MSPMFLNEFKQHYRATCCRENPVSGYSLCPKHLVQARQHWQGFQDARRTLGKCCYCNRKSWKGLLRCKTHREISRERSRVWWSRKTPEFKYQWWKSRRQKWLLLGKCSQCYEHNDLTDGFNRCEQCRTKHKNRKKGEVPEGTVTIKNAAGRIVPVVIRPQRPYSERW